MGTPPLTDVRANNLRGSRADKRPLEAARREGAAEGGGGEGLGRERAWGMPPGRVSASPDPWGSRGAVFGGPGEVDRPAERGFILSRTPTGHMRKREVYKRRRVSEGLVPAESQRGDLEGGLESQRKGHRGGELWRAGQTGTERKTGRNGTECDRGEKPRGGKGDLESRERSPEGSRGVWWPQRRERREEGRGQRRGNRPPCLVGPGQQGGCPMASDCLRGPLSPLGTPVERGCGYSVWKVTLVRLSLVPLASVSDPLPPRPPRATHPQARGLALWQGGQGRDADGPWGPVF